MEFLLSPIGIVFTLVAMVGLIVAAANPLRGFVMMILYGITSAMCTEDIAVVGFGTGIILVAIVPRVLAEKHTLLYREVLRPRSPMDWMFAGIAILSVIHLVVGILKNNWFRFLLGDFYHLFIEICLVFFVAQVLFRKEENIRNFIRMTSIGISIVALVLLFLLATGWIRAIPGSGAVMAHTNFWRFRYSHHFPLNPLLLVIGVAAVGRHGVPSRWLGIAILSQAAALAVSMKRGAWVAFVTVLLPLPFVVSQRNRLRLALVAIGGVMALGVALMMLPEETWKPIAESAVMDRAASLAGGSEQLGMRGEQTRYAIGLLLKNPAGYGLGSTLQTYKSLDPVHYIHNSFLHHGLMAGAPVGIFLFLILLKSLSHGWRLYRSLPDGLLKGVVLGCLLGLLAIFETSFGEVTVNTFYFPIFVALIYDISHIHSTRDRRPIYRPESREVAADL